MYLSTNRRSRVAEPEVWFRIVHITLDGADGVAEANAPVLVHRADAAGVGCRFNLRNLETVP